ncbi:MAG: hypothetical protein Fur0041_19150 [Bacteroidia bacterium]
MSIVAPVILSGEIKCNDDWTNMDDVTGTTGKICIADTLANAGNIAGSIDICDNTPNQQGDYNIGTIAGTVTFCQSSPCSATMPLCGTSSTGEISATGNFVVFPNPADETITISFEEQTNCTIQIISSTGQVVFSNACNSRVISIDVNGLSGGLYFVIADKPSKRYTARLLVK